MIFFVIVELPRCLLIDTRCVIMAKFIKLQYMVLNAPTRSAVLLTVAALIFLGCGCKSQVVDKMPEGIQDQNELPLSLKIGYTQYMGWFPGDSMVWISDDSDKYYYYDWSKSPPKLVWGHGVVKKLPLGVVRIDDEYACKTTDLEHFKNKGRFSASCTPNGWRLN